MLTLSFLLLLGLADEPYVHDSPAFELRLPSAEWKLQDRGGGGILALVFTPDENMVRRCSVLRFPVAFLADGLETREAQIRSSAGDLYERVGFTPAEISGREATRWEYRVAGGTTLEWAFEEAGAWVVFQVAAPAAAWDDPQQRQALEALAGSFVWEGGDRGPVATADQTPPAEVRASRPAPTQPGARLFEVTRHRIEALFEPDEHTLDVQDTIQLRSHQDDLVEIRLYTTLVEVDDVSADVPLSWSVQSLPNADALVIELEQPLADQEQLTLEVHASCGDFIQTIDQQLVAEIDVVGQVRPGSSFSSHVVWYPMDEVNDAAMDITLDVPAPMTGLTGGRLVESTEDDGRRRFRYVEEYRIPRQLPFGFAVGNYVSEQAVSAGGLELSAWGFPGEEALVHQRVAVLTECAEAFERALGPLPWSPVRFVHVKPRSKETGVSLPGMIVVSDGYFPDLAEVDASDGNLSNPGVLGLLVVADELSHQWNFYASSFPNELAEGISTFTNALFLEVRHGTQAYHKTIGYCRDAWIQGAGGETEYAIADPRVYSNTRYRSVVFCKTPVVLDLLRERLGDEVFFEGLRRAFAQKDLTVDGFERLERGFEEASGVELRPFFDQWFFRAGFPSLSVAHESADGNVLVRVRQEQAGDPFVLAVTMQVECEDGSRHEFPVVLDRAEQEFEWSMPARVRAVTLGPTGRVPATVRSD